MARQTDIRVGAERSFPMATGAVCEEGTMAVINASGFVEPATAAAAKIAVGVFAETLTNTGANGALSIKVRRDLNESYSFADAANPGAIDLADVGSACYIHDGSTVRLLATGTSQAGVIDDVDASGVHVRFTK